MAEGGDQDLLFDPTMKKKKKKKKEPFDINAAMREEGGDAPGKSADGADEDGSALAAAFDESVNLDMELDLTKMKKKKKPKKVFLDDEETAPGEAADGGGGAADDIDDLDMELDLTSKKKKGKKKKGKLLDDSPTADEDGGLPEGQEGEEIDDSKGIDFSPYTDRDYTYEELLNRAFAIMHEKNPEMVAGEKKKFVMKPPQVVKIGAKKTSFANFTEICRMLHRQQKHVLQFLFAELGTQGSVDGNNMLIIKGRFSQKQIENVLRRYIKEYVTCHTCRSPETILEKDTRLFFLRCESCGSRCSVASIKSGYQAVTGKRAAQRAKNA